MATTVDRRGQTRWIEFEHVEERIGMQQANERGLRQRVIKWGGDGRENWVDEETRPGWGRGRGQNLTWP